MFNGVSQKNPVFPEAHNGNVDAIISEASQNEII